MMFIYLKQITHEWESTVLSMCTAQHKYVLIFFYLETAEFILSLLQKLPMAFDELFPFHSFYKKYHS